MGRKREDDEVGRAFADSYRRISDVVAQIPRGKVMTYGQVAEDAGLGRAARLVGYAMHAIGKRLPWQRVVAMRGKGIAQISIKDPMHGTEQRLRLERDGVIFTPSGGIDLKKFGFRLQAKKKKKR